MILCDLRSLQLVSAKVTGNVGRVPEKRVRHSATLCVPHACLVSFQHFFRALSHHNIHATHFLFLKQYQNKLQNDAHAN